VTIAGELESSSLGRVALSDTGTSKCDEAIVVVVLTANRYLVATVTGERRATLPNQNIISDTDS